MKVLAKDLSVSVLLDFYGELLTPKQAESLDLYYNQDLSLAEIALDEGITRQGVRDSIKKAETALLSFEEKLHLAERFSRIESSLEKIRRITDNIEIIHIVNNILTEEELE